MENLLDYQTLSHWLLEYGSIVLFVLLALGIIALPVPEETLMVIAGVLVFNDKLHAHATFMAAYAGSITGITMSYVLGKTAGHYFLLKCFKWLNISTHHLDRAHEWFERYGTWALFIGYFIPGLRHFTGFTAGTTALEYPKFALFAYSGAIVWATTFLSIGYFFGDYVLHSLENLNVNIDDVITAAIVIGIIGFIFYLYKRNHFAKPET